MGATGAGCASSAAIDAPARASGYAYAMRMAVAVGVRLVLILVVIGLIMAAPLVMVYRSTGCREQEPKDVRYSVVAPWDKPSHECRRNERGFHLVKRKLGLD